MLFWGGGFSQNVPPGPPTLLWGWFFCLVFSLTGFGGGVFPGWGFVVSFLDMGPTFYLLFLPRPSPKKKKTHPPPNTLYHHQPHNPLPLSPTWADPPAPTPPSHPHPLLTGFLLAPFHQPFAIARPLPRVWGFLLGVFGFFLWPSGGGFSLTFATLPPTTHAPPRSSLQ